MDFATDLSRRCVTAGVLPFEASRQSAVRLAPRTPLRHLRHSRGLKSAHLGPCPGGSTIEFQFTPRLDPTTLFLGLLNQSFINSLYTTRSDASQITQPSSRRAAT